MDQQAKKDRESNRTRQKNKRGDSKAESNDSPAIPDREETSDMPSLPSGALKIVNKFFFLQDNWPHDNTPPQNVWL